MGLYDGISFVWAMYCTTDILKVHTGKSLSEALIFASTNPQYDEIVHWITSSIHENSKLKPWGEYVVYINWFLAFRTISVHNMFSPRFELGIFIYWTCNSINNVLSYCGLVGTKIRASDKDLPVWDADHYE